VIGATSEWWRGLCELHARSLAPLVKTRGFGMTPSGCADAGYVALKGPVFRGTQAKVKGSGQV